jgi:cation diffusion facilitator CzcD-associated flavoprotein CzcO
MLTSLYSAWKYPNIEGITKFKGKLLHSASWDESYSFKDKKVAVIGIGSSGIQIVPKLAPGMFLSWNSSEILNC